MTANEPAVPYVINPDAIPYLCGIKDGDKCVGIITALPDYIPMWIKAGGE